MNDSSKLRLLATLTLAAVAGVFFVPPIAQPLAYHRFADTRTLLGMPNFWNVISNLPFLFVGLAGLAAIMGGKARGGLPELRWMYAFFFLGVALVCFGSGYYHYSPNNQTLVWDRLPMAMAFTCFVAIMIGEYFSPRLAWKAWLPLVAMGACSVWYWHYTEGQGRGDLRWYALVQFLPLLLLPLVFWLFPSRLTGVGYLWAMIGWYALAKVLEEFDALLFSAGHAMSGHALKHVAAAAGMYCFVLAVRNRQVHTPA
jgi:hypothetical protein